MKKVFLPILICLFINKTNGQDSKSTPNKIYKLNPKIEIPITVGLFGTAIYGFYRLGEKPALDTLQVNALDKNDVWTFDRNVFSQSYPPPSSIYTVSDIVLWTTFFSPALLFLDREIRQSWLDITLLYFETQAVNQNLYVWGGPVFTTRVRPLIYMDEVSMEYKLGDDGTTDSFFSGHVSMTAGASFFIAKVLSDYHPELGAKKWLLYGAALIPPAFVGYSRYRGFNHFPTDIIIGMTIGAAVGVSVPHLHKITKKSNKDLSIVPFTGRYTGVTFSMNF